MMTKLTLRTRITLLFGIMIIAIALLLTTTSIYDANQYFTGIEMNKVVLDHDEVNQSITESEEIKNLDVTVQVMSAQKQFATRSLVMMAVIIVVGIGMTYLIVGSVLKPLTHFSETVKEINDKNLSTQIEIPYAKDEVGSLTMSFNAMLRRLEHSFSSQKRFSSNVAHELKTPLATMKASLQVLKLDNEPTREAYKENAEMIEESTNRLIGIVDGLLELAFEECTTFSDVFSCQEMYENIVYELTPMATENQVNMKIQESNIALRCNKRLLYRAIYNVVENAVKYSRVNGMVMLAAEKKNDTIILTICDDGVGIKENEIANLFEPFYRGSELSSEKVGSGLGLPLVKTVIDQHHGTIDVSSKIGEGTTVQIILKPLY